MLTTADTTLAVTASMAKAEIGGAGPTRFHAHLGTSTFAGGGSKSGGVGHRSGGGMPEDKRPRMADVSERFMSR